MQVLLKQGGTSPIPFLLTDAATGQAGQTGQSGSLTVTVFKPGDTLFRAAGGAITEKGNGLYEYAPTAGETASTGVLYLHASCAGCEIVDVFAQVVAFDPGDSAALGLSSLASAAANSSGNGAALATLTSRIGVPAAASLSADIANLPNALLDQANGVETSLTPRQFMRLVTAILAGRATESGGYYTLKRQDGATTAVTITHDSSGNRVNVVIGSL